MVRIKKIYHRGNYQIGLFFGFDEELKIKAKSLGAQWSQTNKCWYVLYNNENYRAIKRIFTDIEIVQNENDPKQSEPAILAENVNVPGQREQETVHIASPVGELLPALSEEHKGGTPEIAFEIVLKPSVGKYWVLQVPYKKGLPQKLMEIKGVYWNKSHKAFFVLRHVNVKLRVEALLGIGEIF